MIAVGIPMVPMLLSSGLYGIIAFMVNVDESTRRLERNIADGGKLIISDIPDNNRNGFIRGMSDDEATDLIRNNIIIPLDDFLIKQYGSDVPIVKRHNNGNNLKGADMLICAGNKKCEVELKFGKLTDKASGYKSIMKILPTEISELFDERYSLDARKKRNKSLINSYNNGESLDSLVLNEINDNQHHNNKIANMINNNDVLITNDASISYLNSVGLISGSIRNMDSDTDRMRVIIDNHGIPSFEFISADDCNNALNDKRPYELSMSSDERLNIRFHRDDGRLIRMTLNNKNNYHIRKYGLKIESKALLGSPSFNIWVGNSSHESEP